MLLDRLHFLPEGIYFQTRLAFYRALPLPEDRRTFPNMDGDMGGSTGADDILFFPNLDGDLGAMEKRDLAESVKDHQLESL